MPPPLIPTDPRDPIDPLASSPQASEPEPSQAAAPARPADSARPAAPRSDAPVTFIPHTSTGAVGSEPMRIATGRFGDLEAHEIVHLLDAIADERSRARFRESIYISFFVWIAIAWFVFYGPSVLWHAPKLILPADAMRQHELARLVAPVNIAKFEAKPDSGTPRKNPTPTHETPRPAMDAKTLNAIKAMARVTPNPAPPPPPTMAPPATAVAPNLPAPNAITHIATKAPMPSNIPDAPAPQPSSATSLKMGNNNPNNSMEAIARGSQGGSGGNPGGMMTVPGRGGATAGGGPEILSDTQGVDFAQWLHHVYRGTMSAWGPLLPEEIQPPLSKKGVTTLIITVLPDGTIADMKIEGTSHDTALDRAAWGSIISQGKLPDMPKGFHGPNLVFRFRYYVNMDR